MGGRQHARQVRCVRCARHVSGGALSTLFQACPHITKFKSGQPLSMTLSDRRGGMLSCLPAATCGHATPPQPNGAAVAGELVGAARPASRRLAPHAADVLLLSLIRLGP